MPRETSPGRPRRRYVRRLQRNISWPSANNSPSGKMRCACFEPAFEELGVEAKGADVGVARQSRVQPDRRLQAFNFKFSKSAPHALHGAGAASIQDGHL